MFAKSGRGPTLKLDPPIKTPQLGAPPTFAKSGRGTRQDTDASSAHKTNTKLQLLYKLVYVYKTTKYKLEETHKVPVEIL